MTSAEADLEELAERFGAARAELANLRRRLPEIQAELADLKPKVAAAVVADIRTGRRTQVEVSRLTGYTPERIRQMCRAAEAEVSRY